MMDARRRKDDRRSSQYKRCRAHMLMGMAPLKSKHGWYSACYNHGIVHWQARRSWPVNLPPLIFAPFLACTPTSTSHARLERYARARALTRAAARQGWRAKRQISPPVLAEISRQIYSFLRSQAMVAPLADAAVRPPFSRGGAGAGRVRQKKLGSPSVPKSCE